MCPAEPSRQAPWGSGLFLKGDAVQPAVGVFGLFQLPGGGAQPCHLKVHHWIYTTLESIRNFPINSSLLSGCVCVESVGGGTKMKGVWKHVPGNVLIWSETDISPSFLGFCGLPAVDPIFRWVLMNQQNNPWGGTRWPPASSGRLRKSPFLGQVGRCQV